MNKTIKRALALNSASIIRAARCGPTDAARKLVNAYDAIDPWGEPNKIADITLQHLEGIPLVDIREVVAKFPVLKIDGGFQFVDGALPLNEVVALLSLLGDWQPKVILEIGTYYGSTTKAMALNAPQAMVHTVDLPLGFDPSQEATGAMPKDDLHLIKGRQVGKAFATDPEIRNIVQHYADTSKWDFVPVKGASFFFIDGAHTYEYARNDTEKCLSIGAVRSRYILHDCDANHADVVRYLYDLVRQGEPVVRIMGTSLAFFDRKA